MPPAEASYIEVPVPVIPFYPNVPVPQEGAVLHQQQAQAGVSLVQNIGISHTERYPSDVARSVLESTGIDGSGIDGSGIDGSGEYFTCYDFVEYLDLCERKGFRIKGYDTKSGKFVGVPLSYDNRWCPEHRKKLSVKLDRLEAWWEMQSDRPITMITLTAYQDNISVSGQWFKLNHGRDLVLQLLRKYLGDIDYFWAAEPHKSGYVHYHLAVFADVSNKIKDKKGRGLEDKLRDLWSKKYQIGSHTYGLDFSRKEDILKNSDDAVLHLKNYLTKYLSKGFLLGEWTEGILIFNAVAWDTGFRLYGASKRIREVMNCGPEKNRDVVWLETKIQEPAPVEEGEPEKDEIERVIWSRQYIPDWLDSEIWLDYQGKLAEPTFIFTGNWGPPLREGWTERVYDYKAELRRQRVAASTDWDDS